MKKYIETFKKQNIIYKLMTLFLMMVIVLFIFRIVKNTIAGLEFPNELLEAANVHLTNSFLSGNVPYVRENIVQPGTAQPPCNYEYPFLNSVFAAIFSIFTGGNTVAAHYLVSFIAMVGTAVLGSIIIFRHSRTCVGATMGFLLLMFCHWRYGYISASPDGVGLFVTMLTLYMAVRPGIKHRGLFCALGTVAAFYSKQYYAAVAVSIFIYFFFYMRKESLKYFLWCVAFLAASVVLINIFWPVYWVYSILFIFHGTFHGWDASGLINVLNQMKYLAFIFAGMIIVLAVALFQKVRRKKEIGSISEQNADEPSDEATADSKKRTSQIPLFLIQIPVQTLVLFFIGRNDGAYLTYFLQLLIPSLCIATLAIMEQMEIKKNELIFMGAYGMLMVFTVYFGWAKLPMHMLSAEEIDTWHQAYALIDEYREKGPVFHSKQTAYYGMKYGDCTFSTDHDGDITEGLYEEYLSNDLQQLLFPDAGAVYEENIAYKKVLNNRIKNREASMVILLGGYSKYITEEELIAAGYEMVANMDLQMGNMAYNTRFWGLNN